MYDYFEHDNANQRLDADWIKLVAIRELVGLALRESDPPSYQRTISFCKRYFPEMFDPKSNLLARQREDIGINKYRQKSVALSKKEDREVSPLEVINIDIKEQEDLVRANAEGYLLEEDLKELYSIRQKLRKEEYTEQQVLLREVFKVDRKLPISEDGKDYREFELPNNRRLRLKLFHPDKAESSTGADLIYELFWNEKSLVRIVAMQYKMWSGRTFSRSGKKLEQLENQLRKLRCAFCEDKPCRALDESPLESKYRLPYCTAFLRPTDKLQHPDTRLVTSGYYIPRCVIEGLWEHGKRGKFALKDIQREAITYRIFEELFNAGMLGSRWLTYTELEQLYREHNVLKADDHLIIHAQVYSYSSKLR